MPATGPLTDNDVVPPASANAVLPVESEAALDALVSTLLDPQRQRPVVVVTAPSHRDEPYIDAAALAREAGGAADVYLVRTGPLTFRMADALTPMACVYGGAGRLYPPGDAWLDDPYQSPLRFARSVTEGEKATEELIGDVLGAVSASAASWHPPADAASTAATGRVSGLVAPSRALVTLGDGQLATIWSDAVLPGVPVDRLVTVGMSVDGILDLETRRLDVSAMRVPFEAALAGYPTGAVVLAQVTHVQPNRVDVQLYPGVTAALAAADVTANERDDLTELMSPGEPVAVRVVRRPPPAEQGDWMLTMVDVDDDEPILAPPPVLRGGPAWLALADPTAQVVAAAPVAVPPAPPPAPPPATPPAAATDHQALHRQVQDLLAENALLEAQRRDYLTKIEALRAEVERLRTRVREAKAKGRRAVVPPQPAAFADPLDQLRWDIERTWVDRVHPADKPRLPLRPYAVGPQFLDSLERLEGIRRDRVLQVVVDVLVGRPPADTHPLRRSVGAEDRPVTRGDAVLLRAPLQTGTPSARRLHYWKRPDDGIELSRVVLHDDFDP